MCSIPSMRAGDTLNFGRDRLHRELLVDTRFIRQVMPKGLGDNLNTVEVKMACEGTMGMDVCIEWGLINLTRTC